jgi:hypothetical protein
LIWPLYFSYLVRGLQRSDEMLSPDEVLISQARVAGPVILCVVGATIVMLVVMPGKWFIALSGIAFFGLGAAVFMRSNYVPR